MPASALRRIALLLALLGAALLTCAQTVAGQSVVMYDGTPAGRKRVKIDTEVMGTKVKVTMTVYGSVTWMGWGVSYGPVANGPGWMSAHGEGADIVACHELNGVTLMRRYWIKNRGPVDFFTFTNGAPSGSKGTATTITEASCSWTATDSTMTFVRELAATTDEQREITPFVPQPIIFAHGQDANKGVGYHSINGNIGDDDERTRYGGWYTVGQANTGADRDEITHVTNTNDAVTLKTQLKDCAAATGGPRVCNSIQFTVTAPVSSWVGVGLAYGSSQWMTSGGKGTDIVACFGDTPEVKRYWQTGYGPAAVTIFSSGTAVAGATCTRSGGNTEMVFTRSLAASSATEREINPYLPQPVIWAHGPDGATAAPTDGASPGTFYHGTNKGGARIALGGAPPNTVNTGNGITVIAKETGKANMEITVGTADDTWVGVGVSQGPENWMSGNGQGSDIVACFSNSVKRYRITQVGPSGFVDNSGTDLGSATTLSGAACGYTSTFGRYMTFSRAILGGSTELSITPAAAQPIIWARGVDGTASYSYHGVFPNNPGYRYGALTPLNGAINTIVDDGTYKITAQLVGDSHVTFKVVLTHTTNTVRWVGLGISQGPSGWMSGNGQGADIVACFNGVVRRYWITQIGPADFSSGTIVPGSMCSQSQTSTEMQFTRHLVPNTAQELEITPFKPQPIIWANGPDPQSHPATAVSGAYYHGATGKGGASTTVGALALDTFVQDDDGTRTVKISSRFNVAKTHVTIKMEITASTIDPGAAAGKRWAAFGVSNGTQNLMNGDNAGADIVACFGGEVKRYWVTSKGPFCFNQGDTTCVAPGGPESSTTLTDATCVLQDGATVMEFTREIAATGNQRTITPHIAQPLIWAHGPDAGTANPTLGPTYYHGTTKNGGMFAIGGSTPTPAAPTNPANVPPPADGFLDLSDIVPGVSMSATINNDAGTMSVDVRLSHDGWIGLGFSEAGKMVNSDIFICSDSQVMRYWVTQYGRPTGGRVVDGSTCAQASSGTRMTFTRTLVAAGNEIAVTPGVAQPVIIATGAAGVTGLAYHGGLKGSTNLDFLTLSASELKLSGEAVLYAHLIFMALAWGLILPWGVSIASRTRTVEGAPKGAWFHVHKNLQYLGWFLQIVGFACAVAYCAEYSKHFEMVELKEGGKNPHTYVGLVVVILGTLQPLNAFFRPHATQEGETKKATRFLWEILHKGSGWVAVLLGMINVVLGVLLARDKNYDNAVVGFAAALAAVGLIPVLIFFVVASIIPNNCCSKRITSMPCGAAQPTVSAGKGTDVEGQDFENPARASRLT